MKKTAVLLTIEIVFLVVCSSSRSKSTALLKFCIANWTFVNLKFSVISTSHFLLNSSNQNYSLRVRSVGLVKASRIIL